MAYSDYQHCWVCDAKTFYDAEVSWEYQYCELVDVVSLCKDCAKKYKIKVVSRDTGDDAPKAREDQPMTALDLEVRDE